MRSFFSPKSVSSIQAFSCTIRGTELDTALHPHHARPSNERLSDDPITITFQTTYSTYRSARIIQKIPKNGPFKSSILAVGNDNIPCCSLYTAYGSGHGPEALALPSFTCRRQIYKRRNWGSELGSVLSVCASSLTLHTCRFRPISCKSQGAGEFEWHFHPRRSSTDERLGSRWSVRHASAGWLHSRTNTISALSRIA